MRYYLVVLLQIVGSYILAQSIIIPSKPAIDTAALNKWSRVGWGVINHKGDYVAYQIWNEPLGSRTLVLKSIQTSWEERIVTVAYPVFLDASNAVIFKGVDDSICILQLGSDQKQWIIGINQYQIFGKGDFESLIYSLKAYPHRLIVRNLLSGIEKVFDDIDGYNAFNDNRTIFLKGIVRSGLGVKQSLSSLDIRGFDVTPIWSSADGNVRLDLNSLVYDTSHAQLAFQMEYMGRKGIWYYQYGADQAVKAIDHYVSDGKEMDIGDIVSPGFSKDGKRLFFRVLNRPVDSLFEKRSSNVDIWNYQYESTQSQQDWSIQQRDGTMGVPADYLAILQLSDKKVLRVSYGNESVEILSGESTDFCFIQREHDSFDHRHKRMLVADDSLVFLKGGERIGIDLRWPVLSYAGKFLLGVSRSGKYYAVYDLSLDMLYNVSMTFPEAVRLDPDGDRLSPSYTGLSLAGWMADDSAMIMYDKYDLWKVDPLGRKPAVNLTSYYGRTHHLILRLIGNYSQDRIISGNATYILSAFNEETKEEGFFKFSIRKQSTPQFLYMGPYHHDGPYRPALGWLEWNDSSIYLVNMESASQSSNYYVTKDFRAFKAISHVCPELKYNWMTSEVVHWVGPDGRRLAGVIYKPEDFDPGKKYPVIINYYEKVSQKANNYLMPELASNNINIPWFVSRGYIVFRPDINYSIGEPGPSACNAVVSGTEYLMKYPWINQRKIGIQGHSWGGYETDYIVAHSHLYAAALSASGTSDFVTLYGSTNGGGNSMQFSVESSQSRMGFALWERPDLYVKNSPVFSADKITTPLLMMNNKNDLIVPFGQGVELFMALWRLGKEVWLLQYDGEGHSLDKQKNELDYTIRMTQFFDHYLKDFPEPSWMNTGVPKL